MSASILVAYATRYGSTQEVAEPEHHEDGEANSGNEDGQNIDNLSEPSEL